MGGYRDANRTAQMYKGLGINMPENMQFKTADEVSNYAKLATDLKKDGDNAEIKKMYYGILQDRADDTVKSAEEKLKNQQTTRKQIYMDSPQYQGYLQNQVDPTGKFNFQGGKNINYLQEQLKTLYGTDLNESISTDYGKNLLLGLPQLNQAKTGFTNQKTKAIPIKLKIDQQNADSKKTSAEKPRGGGKGGAGKLENNQEYRNDLADYSGATDPKMKAWGKKEFIRKHGVDPDKKLEQGNGYR
jgi:hypothetical protein